MRIGIRVQHFRSKRIRIQIQGFDDQYLKKIYGKTYIFFSSKIEIYLSLGLHKKTSKLQENPSVIKRGHPALQNFKFLHLFLFFEPFLPF
jgi:hypothetical protein